MTKFTPSTFICYLEDIQEYHLVDKCDTTFDQLMMQIDYKYSINFNNDISRRISIKCAMCDAQDASTKYKVYGSQIYSGESSVCMSMNHHGEYQIISSVDKE